MEAKPQIDRRVDMLKLEETVDERWELVCRLMEAVPDRLEVRVLIEIRQTKRPDNCALPAVERACLEQAQRVIGELLGKPSAG